MNAYATGVVSYLFTQSWQIATLAGLVGLASFALRDRSAHLRYLLWLIVVAKCLVPPLLTVPVAVLPERPPAPSVGGFSLPEEPLVAEFPPLVGGSVTPPDPGPAMPTVHELAALAWIAGVAIFLLWVGGSAVRYTAWLRARRKPLPHGLQESIRALSAGLKFRRQPRIWLVEDIGQPFVWGLLQGGVYLPADFACVGGSDRQRNILAHELSHVARLDAGVNLLQVLAQAIYWFHPFVWWANRKIRQEREKCCDETAIAHLHASPEQYTEAIVDALAAERQSAHPIPSLAIVGSIKDIEERIKVMLRPGRTFRTRPTLMAATVALLIALVTVPTAFVLTAGGQGHPPTQSAGGEWKMAWSDEFSESGLPNPAKWDYETGFRVSGQQGYYTRERKENARVEDGMLVIEARKEKWKNPTYNPNAKSGSPQTREFADYTSARLTTRGDASWTYGRIEVRAKLPTGHGTHTSIWMLGTNMREVGWPACGETDIMTNLGGQPGVLRALVQTTAYNTGQGTPKSDVITVTDAAEAFHVYAVEWGPGHMDFFVDSQKYFTFRKEGSGTDVWPFDKPQRLLLNLALGDTWAGPIDDSIFPQRFYIDYVRVYQKPAAHAPNQPAADSGHGMQPRFAARTFNSEVALTVWIKKISLRSEPLILGWIGSTPSTTPLDIPACWLWGVQVSPPVKDWGLLRQELSTNEVPGLMMRNAVDSDLQQLVGLVKLRMLMLWDSEITDEGMDYIKSMSHLEHLLMPETSITDAGMERLKGMTELQDLDLDGTRLTVKSLEYLKGMTALRGFALRGMHITDAGLEQIKDMTRLQVLVLPDTLITGPGLEYLEGMADLKALDLQGTKITDAGIGHIPHPTNLHYLVLGKTQITNAGLEHIKGLTQLQELILDDTLVTDAGVGRLKDLTRLRRLGLGGTKITNAGLAHLQGLASLEYLSLSGTQVTDTGLEHLKGLTQLQDLRLQNTQVTNVGVARLKQGLPKLEVTGLEAQ